MSDTPKTIPDGYHTVTPWIISRDTAGLIGFLKDAFGAEEIDRVLLENGSIGHAEVRIGDSVVMMFDAQGSWPETPAFIRLYVQDGEAVHRRALAAGAVTVTEPAEHAWGDRLGRLRDPFGNVWWIQEPIEDVTPEEMGSRFGQQKYADAMREALDSLDREMSSRKS